MHNCAKSSHFYKHHFCQIHVDQVEGEIQSETSIITQ